MNKLVKTVKKTDLYREFLRSLDGVLQLTDREQDIMVLLIELDINTPKLPGYSKNVISTEDDEWMVNPALIPEVIGDRVQITIVLRLDRE